MTRIDEPIVGDLVELDSAFIGEQVKLGIILSVLEYVEPMAQRTWSCRIFSLTAQRTDTYRIVPGMLNSIILQRCFDD